MFVLSTKYIYLQEMIIKTEQHRGAYLHKIGVEIVG